MSTGSIKHNIEIANPADAERFVEALEEAERISEEGMERLIEIKTHVTGFCYADKKEGVFVQDVFAKLAAYEDTGLTPEQIQAQQQEIDRLKATLADWKYNTKCDADHIAALTADKDEQTEQMKYLLRRTLPILEVANDQQGLIDAINALLGGKEDEK